MTDLAWQQLTYLTLSVVGAMIYIAKAGKPREDYPEGIELVIFLVLNVGYVWLVLSI